ncbi:MAG: hypothetical protein ACRENM_04425 [Candidatus Dormibacteraceae bacterium]
MISDSPVTGADLGRSVQCPACGTMLPPQARYCARCGRPVTPAPAAPVPRWLLVLLWSGSVLAALLTVLYAYIYASPDFIAAHATSSVSASSLRAAAAAIAIGGGAVCILQPLATWALGRGWAWGRILISLVSILWFPTLIGIPVSILVLAVVWWAARPAPPIG